MKLTALEIKLLNAMRNNEYNDSLDSGGTWVFTAIDNSGMESLQARGVISSLIKKGLVTVDKDDDAPTISFTTAGKNLFEIADGKPCTWGGKLLLKEI